MIVVGVEPGSLLGNAWNQSNGRLDAIRQADGIVVDDCEGEKLEYPRLGDVREIGGRRARIVGMSHGIMGFLVTPYVFTTYERAAAYIHKSPEVASYFLVQLDPGADPEEVCAAIRRRVPELEAMPRNAYSAVSINFWMTRTGLGISFGAATLLGLLVGLVMVAQTLYAMVLDRLGEFGTLKAIGAREGQIYSILLVQATAMAMAGSVLGLVLVLGIQHVFSTPQAPIVIPLALSLASCVLVLLICWLSSWLPYHRIRKVDPLMVLAMIAGPPLYALESEPCVIHAEGVHKSYRRGDTNTPVLRGIDLDVCRGQCVYLAGPSGSGKTTLLSILGCILSPDRGRVKILGEDLDDLHPAERIQLRRDRLGFIFQRFQLVRGLTALENVCVPLALRGTAPRAARNRGMELLDAVGLADKARGLPCPTQRRPVPARRPGPGAGQRSRSDSGR